MKSCMKYRSGEDIGGGCAHLAGLREGWPVYAALSYCKQRLEAATRNGGVQVRYDHALRASEN